MRLLYIGLLYANRHTHTLHNNNNKRTQKAHTTIHSPIHSLLCSREIGSRRPKRSTKEGWLASVALANNVIRGFAKKKIRDYYGSGIFFLNRPKIALNQYWYFGVVYHMYSVCIYIAKSCWLLWFDCSVHVNDEFSQKKFGWEVGGWGEFYPSFFWIFWIFKLCKAPLIKSVHNSNARRSSRHAEKPIAVENAGKNENHNPTCQHWSNYRKNAICCR